MLLNFGIIIKTLLGNYSPKLTVTIHETAQSHSLV